MDFFSVEYFKGMVHTYAVPFAIDLVLAILIFVVGRAVARGLVRLMRKIMVRSKLDESLTRFLGDVLYALLLVIVTIASLERLGVNTTSAIAVLGAVGLAIGLALQGSLGNFASGVMILGYKPYKVGDWVRVSGEIGAVESIKIFNTVLLTGDNRRIYVPNGQITSSVIENITSEETRRVDLVFGIGYEDDVDKAREVMTKIVGEHEMVLADPAPLIAVDALGDSSVNFVVRPWCKQEHYWDVKRQLTEQIKKAFDEHGISIPFPQRDVHLYQESAA